MLFHGKDGKKDGKEEDNGGDWNFRGLCITNLLERVLLGLESKRTLLGFDEVFSYACRHATSLGIVRSTSFSNICEAL